MLYDAVTLICTKMSEECLIYAKTNILINLFIVQTETYEEIHEMHF